VEFAELLRGLRGCFPRRITARDRERGRAYVAFAGELFECILAFKKAWRQVAPLGEFLRAFVRRMPIDEERRRRWSTGTLALIKEFDREGQSPGAKASVDFSAPFDVDVAVVVAVAPHMDSVKSDWVSGRNDETFVVPWICVCRKCTAVIKFGLEKSIGTFSSDDLNHVTEAGSPDVT
jgi:hypothetical protein